MSGSPPIGRLPKTIDRSFVRMVAFKRIFTGSLSLLCGVGFVIALIVHGSPPPLAAGVALLIFFGGGTWTLRTGLRLRRELKSQ